MSPATLIEGEKMNYNFKILNNSYKTINYINKLLINYPKKEIVLKNNIEKTCYSLIKNIFAYNINTSMRIKDKYLKDLSVELSMLDFYTKVSLDKKIISYHQFTVIGRFLIEIRKMINGLRKKETSNEE